MRRSVFWSKIAAKISLGWILFELFSEAFIGLDLGSFLFDEVEGLFKAHLELIDHVTDNDAGTSTNPIGTMNKNILLPG